MSKLTTELLEKFVSDIKTDGMCDITDHQVALALRQLLAYEQAAKNPVASCWIKGGVLQRDQFIRYDVSNFPDGEIGLFAIPVLPKQSDGALIDEGTTAAPAQPVIPIGLVQAINRLLDNDGSRGCFDALEQHRAKTELELLLAAAQQNEPQNIPENIPAQPVSNPYKFLGERAKYRVIIEGFSNSRSVDFEACSQEEAEEIGRDIFHEECNYGVERLESIPAQESE